MAVEGSLDLFSLPEILQMISQQGKTGILTIQGQQDIVAISFLSGRIVAADSLAHTIEEGLSKLLVDEGLLSAAELARAAAEHQAGAGRLLDLLVERRYLTRQQLLAALRLQTVRQLEALLRWQEGDFKFYSGDEVSYEEGFEPISVEDLLLRNLADFASRAAQAAPPALQARPTRQGQPAQNTQNTQSTRETRGIPPARTFTVQPPPSVAGSAARPAPRPPAANPGAAPRAGAPPVGARSVVPGKLPAAAATRPAPAAPAGPAAVESGGELWLPQVPELPEVSLAGAPPGKSPPAAAPVTTGLPALATAAVGAAALVRPPAESEPVPWPAAALTAPAASEPVPWPAAALTPPPEAPAPGGPRPRSAGGVGVAGTAGAAVAPEVPPPAAAMQPRPGAPIRLRPQRFRQMRVEQPERVASPAHRLAPAVLALAAAIALVAFARLAPDSVLLPLPWEQSERAALERNQRESLYDKIEGAAKTAFLRDGRFPDQLGQLRDSGLLSPDDLEDPRGEPLLYSAREESYTLQATESGKAIADADTSGSIAGNFFLDPSLLQASPQGGPPIVLLD
ncbi:MAG TPA: DUF4388 domain-containing protein [Thermoanaerobaculia bacterium]|nr:DUF4388 domain-containing protein [Thermoanaerobaculia bacterium]